MGKTILVADDSASVRLAVRILLENRHEKLVIRKAFDGADAIEKAKKLLEVAMQPSKSCAVNSALDKV